MIFMDINPVDDLKKMDQYLESCAEVAKSQKVTSEVIENLSKLWLDLEESYKVGRIENPDRCLEALLICTAQLIFNVQYHKAVSEGSKDKLKSVIDSCAETMNDVAHRRNICKGITTLVNDPWRSKAFEELTKSFSKSGLNTSAQVSDALWETEGWVMLETRLDYLTRLLAKPTKTKVNPINKVCSLIHVLVNRGHEFFQNNGFDPTITPKEQETFNPFTFPWSKYLKYLQVYAILVYKEDIDEEGLSSWNPETMLKVIEQLEKVNGCTDGNLFPGFKWWNESAAVARFLAEKGTVQFINSKGGNAATLEILFSKWIQLSEIDSDGIKSASESPFTPLLDRMINLSASTENLYKLAPRTLELKFTKNPDLMREMYLTMYVRAMNKDINCIESTKTTDPEKLEEIEEKQKRLSVRYIELAIFFKEFLATAMNCLFTAFSLNPCDQLFEFLFPGKLSGSENVPVSGFTELEKCSLDELKKIPVSDADPKVVDKLPFPDELLEALDIVITNPRYKGLSRWVSKSESEQLCRKLLESKSVGALENRSLEFINIDYEKFQDFKPQYDPDDDGIERGFRWGVRKINTTKSRAKNVLNRARMTFKSVTSSDTAEEVKRKRRIADLSKGRSKKLPSPNGVIRKGRPPKVKPEHDSKSVVNNGAKKDNVDARGIPNICLSQNPWWSSDDDNSSLDITKYGYGEMYMKLIRPYDNLMREKTGTGKNSEDDSKILSRVKRTLFPDFTAADTSTDVKVGSSQLPIPNHEGPESTGECSAKIEETPIVKQEPMDGLSLPKTEKSQMTPVSSNPPVTNPNDSTASSSASSTPWNPSEGDGFPHDPYNEQIFRDMVLRIFIATNIDGAKQVTKDNVETTKPIPKVKEKKEKVRKRKEPSTTETKTEEPKPTKKVRTSNTNSAKRKRSTGAIDTSAKLSEESSVHNPEIEITTDVIKTEEAEECVSQPKNAVEEILPIQLEPCGAFTIMSIKKEEGSVFSPNASGVRHLQNPMPLRTIKSDPVPPPISNSSFQLQSSMQQAPVTAFSYQRSSLAGNRKSRKSSATEEQMQKWNETISSVSTGPFTLPPTVANASTSNDIFVTNISNKPEHKNPNATGSSKIDSLPRPAITKTYPAKKKRLVVIPSRMYEEFHRSTPSIASTENVIPDASRLSMESNANQLNATDTNITETQTGDVLNNFSCSPSSSCNSVFTVPTITTNMNVACSSNSALPISPSVSCSSDVPTSNLRGVQAQPSAFDQPVPSGTNLVGSALPKFPSRSNDVVSPYNLASTPVNLSTFNQSTVTPRLKPRKIKIAGFPNFYDQSCSSETVPLPASSDSSNSSLQPISGLAVSDHALVHTNTHNEGEKSLDKAHEIVENMKVTEVVYNSWETNGVTNGHSEATAGQETKSDIICSPVSYPTPSSELVLNVETVNEKSLSYPSKNQEHKVVVSNVCASKDNEKQKADKSTILLSDSSSGQAQKDQIEPETGNVNAVRGKDEDNKISDLVNHVSCSKMDCSDGENKHAEAKPIVKLSQNTSSTSLIEEDGEQQKATTDVDVQVQNGKQLIDKVSGTNLVSNHDEPLKSSRSGSSVKAPAPYRVQLGFNIMQLSNMISKKDVKNVKANSLTKDKEAAKPAIDKSSKQSVSVGKERDEPPTSVPDTVGQRNLNECSSDLSILPTSTNLDEIPSSSFLDAVSPSEQEKVNVSNVDKTLSSNPVVDETLSPTLLEKSISPAYGKVPFIEGNVPLPSDHKAPNELEKGCSSTVLKTVTPLSELAKVSINPVKVPPSSMVSEVEPEQSKQFIEKENEVSDLAKPVTLPIDNFEYQQDSVSLPLCFSSSIESSSEKTSEQANVSPNKICVSTEDSSCNSITNQSVDLNLNISEGKRPSSFNDGAEILSNNSITPHKSVSKCASSEKYIITAVVEKNKIIANSFSGLKSPSTEIAGTTSNISFKEEEKTEDSDKVLTPDIANSKQAIALINHDDYENTVEENLEHPVSLSPTSALQRDLKEASEEAIIIGNTNCDNNAESESHNQIDLNDSSCYSPKEKLRETHSEISSDGPITPSLETLYENATSAIPENSKNILPNDDIASVDKILEEIICKETMAEEVLDVTQSLPETLCKESDMNTLVENAKPSTPTKAVNKVHVLNDESNDSIKSLAPNDIDPFIDDLINGYDYPVKGIIENENYSVNFHVCDVADPVQTSGINSSLSRPGSSASVESIKVPRPATPVHVVEDIINRQLKKQPKRPYDEVETIKIAPTVLEYIRRTGERLTRLLLCSVVVRELSSEEISPKISHQLKKFGYVKRSSRLKKKKTRAVEVIRNVLQSANKNEDESSSEEEEEEEKNDRRSLSNERVVETKYQRPGPKSKKKEELANKDVDSYLNSCLRKLELYKSKRQEEAAKIKLPVGQQVTARKRSTGSPQKVKQTTQGNSIDAKKLLMVAINEAHSSSDPRNQTKKVVKQQKRNGSSKVLRSSKKLKTTSSTLKDYSDSSSDSDDVWEDSDFDPYEDEEKDKIKTATTSKTDLPLYRCYDFHPPSEEVDLAANDPLAMQGSQPEEHEEIVISSGSEDDEEDLDPITSGEIEGRAPYVEEPVKVIGAPSSIDDMHITPDVITGDIDQPIEGQNLRAETREEDSDSEIEFLLEKPVPQRNRTSRLLGRKSIPSSTKRTSSTSGISPKRPRTSSHSHEVTQVETYSTTPEFPTAYVQASPHKPNSFSPVGQTFQSNSLNSAEEEEATVANYYVEVIPETLIACSDQSNEAMIVPESILPDDLECTENLDLAILPDDSLEPENVVDEAILPDDECEDLDTEVDPVRIDEGMDAFIIPELTSDNIGEEQDEYCNVLLNAKSPEVGSDDQERTEEMEASCEDTDANSSILPEAIVEDVAGPESTLSRMEEIGDHDVQERPEEMEASCEDTDANSFILPEAIVEDVAEPESTLSRTEEIGGNNVQERTEEVEASCEDTDANSSLLPEAIVEDFAEPERTLSRTEEIGGNDVQERAEEVEASCEDTDANSSLLPEAIVEDVAEPERTLSRTEEIGDHDVQERAEEIEASCEDTDANSSILPEAIVEDVARPKSTLSSTEEIGDHDVQERPAEMEALCEDTDGNSFILPEAIVEDVAKPESTLSSTEEIGDHDVQERPAEMEALCEDTDANSFILPEAIVEDVAEPESTLSSTEEIGGYDGKERFEEIEASYEDIDANSSLLPEAIEEDVSEPDDVQDLVTDKNNEEESLQSTCSVILEDDSQTSEHSCSPGLPELSPVHSAFERMDYAEDDSPPSLSAVI